MSLEAAEAAARHRAEKARETVKLANAWATGLPGCLQTLLLDAAYGSMREAEHDLQVIVDRRAQDAAQGDVITLTKVAAGGGA